MTKFCIAVFVTVLVCQGYSSPLMRDGDIAKLAEAGDWDGVHKLLRSFVTSQVPSPQTLPQLGSVQFPSFSGDLSNKGSGSGGRYYSQSEYSYQSKMTDRDGKVSEDKGGYGMINDNGKVSYYTPQPKAIVAPYSG
ncbi:hypothetical protein NE865_07790 [Phthorimaea operculella]|nr:hypothetical protein NE865_07790 [Phthorimaea operculella]